MPSSSSKKSLLNRNLIYTFANRASCQDDSLFTIPITIESYDPAAPVMEIAIHKGNAETGKQVTALIVTVDTYLISVQVGPYAIPGIEVIAMQEGTEIIIGRDVLNQLIVTLNGLAHKVEIS